MNSLPNPESEVQAWIEDYLDYLCAPLLGVASYAERRRFRMEAADHLIALVEDFEAEGAAPGEAAEMAFQEYGRPWAVGQSFADSCIGESSSRLLRFTDAATLRAFSYFGAPAVFNLLLIEWDTLGPWHSSHLPLVQCLAVASPIAAGALTGAGMGIRSGRSVCRAVALLGLISVAAGLMMLPTQDGLGFAIFQFAFWAPAGALMANVTAALRRHLRLQRSYRAVR